MKETWLPVVDFEGLYEVSDRGRVRSLDRIVKTKHGRLNSLRGQILSAYLDDRYWVVSLSKNGRLRRFRVHVLVAEAFISRRPEGMVVRHGPKGRNVNIPSNLSWGTQAQNLEDRVRDNGGHPMTLRTHCARAGHEFTPENTYIVPKTGGRSCRACRSEKNRQRYLDKLAAASQPDELSIAAWVT